MKINNRGVVVAAVVLLTLMAIGLVGHYVAIAKMGQASQKVAKIDEVIARFEERQRELEAMGAKEASLVGMAKLPPEVLAAYQRFERDVLASRSPRYDDPAVVEAVTLLTAAAEKDLGELQVNLRVDGRNFEWRERREVDATVLHSVIKYYLLPVLRQDKARGMEEVQAWYGLTNDVLVDVNVP